MRKTGKFRFKVFISFVLTFSFFGALLSGLALYLSPKGRIANWIEWTWLGVTKDGWTAVHIIFVAVFLTAAIFHLFWFNWKVFWSYLKSKTVRTIHYKWEFAVSILLIIILIGGIIGKIPPVYSLVNLSEWIDASYEKSQNEPPIPHAEELTLAEFAAQILKLEPDTAKMILEKAGYRSSGITDKIAEIAENNNVAPSKIFDTFKNSMTSAAEIKSYAGFGKKTLTETCAELGVKIKVAGERLKAQGLIDYSPEETIKEIASRYNLTPIEVVKIIDAIKTTEDNSNRK